MQCQEKLEVLLELGRIISNETNLDNLLSSLGEVSRKVVDGDRASIFIYDDEEKILWTKVAQGVEGKIVIPVDKGVAGYTVLSKESQIVLDAYTDHRFFKDIDKHTGYKTENILTVPMINRNKNVIGVFQVLNKTTGIFDKKDAEIILLLADYAASILENAILYNKLEQKFYDSQKRFELIALTTNDGFWDWNFETNTIYLSTRFKEILGYKDDEFKNSLFSIKKVLDKKEIKKIRKNLTKHFITREPFSMEIKIKTKNNKTKWLLTKGQTQWDNKNRPLRMLGSNTDITELIEKEKIIENRKKELELAKNKIESLLLAQDNFIKSAMHEINTPVTIINMYLEVLSRDINHPKYLQRILSATKTLSTIYDDFNYFVNKDKLKYKKENINLTSFLNERIEYFSDIATANGLILTSSLQKDLNIYINRVQLQRVVDNTISNSVKYTPEGGEIDIRLFLEKNIIKLAIKDTGIGIKDCQKIFNEYYRESTHKGGFGIGLSIIKEICQYNNIHIDLETNLGKGSEFIYSFNKENN